MKVAIVLGTSRQGGNTAHLIDNLSQRIDFPVQVFDLVYYEIAPYDYDYNNQNDDFMSLMEEITEGYDAIILASPVYWYAPSAQLKVFMDRLSDLLDINKPLGRALKGKYAGLIATGVDKQVVSCFEDIFKGTYRYLHMNYLGMQYCPYLDDKADTALIQRLTEELNQSLTEAAQALDGEALAV